MPIKNRDTKHDIRIRSNHTTQRKAERELRRHGYRPRPEANDLPVKYEKPKYPALTIASDDNRKSFLIVGYPSDAEIIKNLPDRVETPANMDDRWDKGKFMKEGTLIDIDDKRLKGK